MLNKTVLKLSLGILAFSLTQTVLAAPATKKHKAGSSATSAKSAALLQTTSTANSSASHLLGVSTLSTQESDANKTQAGLTSVANSIGASSVADFMSAQYSFDVEVSNYEQWATGTASILVNDVAQNTSYIGDYSADSSGNDVILGQGEGKDYVAYDSNASEAPPTGSLAYWAYENEKDIDSLSSNATNSNTALDNLSTKVTTLSSTVATAQSNITTDQNHIATNKTSIATNTTNIGDNTTNIGDNKTSIGTNAANITSNKTDFTQSLKTAQAQNSAALKASEKLSADDRAAISTHFTAADQHLSAAMSLDQSNDATARQQIANHLASTQNELTQAKVKLSQRITSNSNKISQINAMSGNQAQYIENHLANVEALAAQNKTEISYGGKSAREMVQEAGYTRAFVNRSINLNKQIKKRHNNERH